MDYTANGSLALSRYDAWRWLEGVRAELPVSDAMRLDELADAIVYTGAPNAELAEIACALHLPGRADTAVRAVVARIRELSCDQAGTVTAPAELAAHLRACHHEVVRDGTRMDDMRALHASRVGC